MATQLQIRRGTAAQVAAFTGAEGEIVYNSTNDSLHTNDGSTAGGFELARADGANFSSSVSFTTLSAATFSVSGAATFTGEITANGGISLVDNKKLTFGTGDDLEVYHDGNNSYINDVGTGNIFIRGANVVLATGGGTKYLEGGSNVLRLYHTGNQRMQTSAAGISVTGTVTATGTSIFDALDISGAITASGEITANGGIALGDNDKATFGVGDDLQIYHDGSNSYVKDNGAGDLIIQAYDDIKFQQSTDNASLVTINTGGNVTIHSGNLDVTGTATMDGLVVQGTSTTRPTIGNSDVNTSGLTTGLNFEPISNLTNGAKLNVVSGLQPTVASAYTAGFEFVTEDHLGGGTFAQTKAVTIGASGDVSFYEDTGTTAKFFWDASAESLGIGTSTVESTLHLQAASAGGRGATLTIDNNAASTVGNESQITFLTNAGASVAGTANARIKAISTNAGDGSADLTFTTWNGSAEGERLRISGANVGIGTSSPARGLHVNNNGESFIRVTSSNTGNAGIEFGDQSDGVQGAIFQNSTDNSLRFNGYNNSEAMRIASTGAATFSSSVTTGGEVSIAPSSGTAKVRLTSQGAGSEVFTINGQIPGVANGGFAIRNETDSRNDFTIDAVGAATFNSSVSLGGTLSVTGATTLSAAAVINANVGSPMTVNANLNSIAYSEIFNINTGANAAAYFGIVTLNLANTGTIRSGMFFDSSNHLNFINGEAGGAGIVLHDNNAVTMSGSLTVTGGVYLGGTGAANKLDDYESGSWTPSLGGTWSTNPTTLVGSYTKIGNVVHIAFNFSGGVKGSIVGGYFTGLPFITSQSGTGSVTDSGVNDKGNCLFFNTDRVWVTANAFSGATYITGTYTTTA